MKRALILVMILTASSCVFAQEGGNAVFFQSQGAGPVTTVGVGMLGKPPGAPVQGAPYSATITNENIQTLEDGTHITQTSTGNIARDSQGRTRQDASLPAIGNLSAADAPHLVFIQDPVAQTVYTLNLTDKTAQKMPSLPPNITSSGPASGGKFVMQMGTAVAAGGPPPLPPPGIMMQRTFIGGDQGQVNTEDLGSQTMEGVQVTGVRTTRTIPVGEIGNDRPISIVTEVWTSPDLKTIVYSKRSDPRMGEQTFQLTNIVRSEPDASLFTVPPDFKIVDGPRDVIYRSNQ
ncbi:MAG TPA: hypothetical protein VN976_24295 [Verrucomicrobiae bacterium]|nr:hypothetical protein [Verrucomicrobiae bacterium]